MRTWFRLLASVAVAVVVLGGASGPGATAGLTGPMPSDICQQWDCRPSGEVHYSAGNGFVVTIFVISPDGQQNPVYFVLETYDEARKFVEFMSKESDLLYQDFETVRWAWGVSPDGDLVDMVQPGDTRHQQIAGSLEPARPPSRADPSDPLHMLLGDSPSQSTPSQPTQSSPSPSAPEPALRFRAAARDLPLPAPEPATLLPGVWMAIRGTSPGTAGMGGPAPQ